MLLCVFDVDFQFNCCHFVRYQIVARLLFVYKLIKDNKTQLIISNRKENKSISGVVFICWLLNAAECVRFIVVIECGVFSGTFVIELNQ